MVHERKHHFSLNYLAACFIHVLFSPPAKHLWKLLCALKVVNNQNKRILLASCQSKTKKHAFTHVTQCFAHRQTLGSGLGFIREMHSIAISGKHILPCTYPLIALLLQRQDRWLYIWCCVLFQLAKFSGSVAMCPRGTVCEVDNLNRAKLGLNSLTVSWTKNTLDVTNEDYIVQMEDFVVSPTLFSTKCTISLHNQISGCPSRDCSEVADLTVFDKCGIMI